MPTQPRRNDSRTKLLESAVRLIRAKGYASTSVDDICQAATLTKGSFFHYFKSKEELAVAAAAHFAMVSDAVDAAAPFRASPDPLERLLGYVDFRASLLRTDPPDSTCLLGMLVQETSETHHSIREACAGHMSEQAGILVKDIAEAKARYAPDAPWSAESLATHIQAVIQGSFIMAKARREPRAAAACLEHLSRYLELLFTPT